MKKMLKNFFEIILFFVIFNIILIQFSQVQAVGVSVSSATVTEGNTVTVNFNVSDASSGYQGNVSYDTSKLEFSSCNFSTSSDLNCYNDGKVASALGSSFSIVFKAKASGTATVSFGNILLGDGSSLASASGKVTINATQPSAPANPAPEVSNSSSSSQTPSAPTEKEPNFKEVNDTVYATKSMNVRSSWSTSSKKIGGLSKDQGVTRTGIGDNGWSRISYNGKTAYVSTALITTTKPEEKTVEEPKEEPKEENNTNETEANTIENEEDSENKDENEVEDETLPEENNESIDEEAYNNIVSKIGTIPEVGNNINIYIFFFICIISLSSIFIIFKK